MTRSALPIRSALPARTTRRAFALEVPDHVRLVARHRDRQRLISAVTLPLEPERVRYAYVYAVGLHSAGRGSEALTALKEISARHPGDRETLLALISFSRDAGDFPTALEYAERLAGMTPGDPDVIALIENLRRQAKVPDAQSLR